MFLEKAKQGNTGLFFYILTILICYLSGVMGAVLVYGLIEVDTVDRNQTLIGLLFPFVTILAGLLLCTFYLHKRPIHSLFNAFNGFRTNRLFFGFFTWLVLCGLSDVVYYYFLGGVYHLQWNPTAFLVLLFVAITMISIQSMTEEVLFRSYLLSGLALVLKYRYLAITVSSLMFALMHIGNPENEKFGYVLMFFFYFGTALILGVIAVLDEGIEQTIGIHIATNMYGALFVNFNDAALKTDSLFIIDNPMGINMVILNFISFLIYLILSKVCFKLKPISFIFKKII